MLLNVPILVQLARKIRLYQGFGAGAGARSRSKAYFKGAGAGAGAPCKFLAEPEQELEPGFKMTAPAPVYCFN